MQPSSNQHTETNVDRSSDAFFHNASAERHNTDIYMYNAIKAAHPDVEVIDTDARNCNIIAYISATGDGSVTSLSTEDIDSELSSSEINALKEKHAFATSLNQTEYLPPLRRLDGGTGALFVDPIFNKYLVKWQGHEFLIYIVDARDGTALYIMKRQYLLTSDTAAAYLLLKTAGFWLNELHGEIWVFDQGFWQKDAGLYRSIQKSRWEDIILPEELKEDLLKTVVRFYKSRETYERLHVPWKRGLIFYGPPGNGKTISIKATMKTLYDLKDPIPTIYVKSLVSFGGPQYSINLIFAKARQQAPCYLVFEDLDSLVTDEVRSFFLNAVDGLSENEGILMVGSTNHLDRLDPGIAKRPSRFDRKYLFPDPDMKQRIQYCKFWQRKLKDNKDIEFPDKLLSPIADLTDGFSFAYMQEAFVSTLLKIANEAEEASGLSQKILDKNAINLSELEDELVVIEKTTAAEKKAIGLFDYRAMEDNELSFDEGDELLIVDDEISEDWWYLRRVKDGKTGLAPRPYFEVCNSFCASDGKDDQDLDQYVLWREIKVQIANLKKELDKADDVKRS